MFGQESLHLYLLNFGSDAVIGRVSGDQPFFDRSLEGAVECEVNASDRGTAQTWVAFATAFLDSAVFHQVLVELLQIPGGQLVEFNLPNPWDRVGFDNQLVAVCCGWPDVGLGVELISASQPGGHCVVLSLIHISEPTRPY